MMQTVSAVIPTFNGLHLLKKFLPSVLAELSQGDELVVIDDASTDETTTWMTSYFKLALHTHLEGSFDGIQVVYIQNKTNFRFAKSVNRAVSAARSDLIWLLNNDVKPLPGCLAQLRSHFPHNQLFGVGCIEKSNDLGKEEIQGKNVLTFSQGIFQHSRAADMKSGPTAWVIGGCGLFSKDKWHCLSGFDPNFAPAYWEDLDLSFRAHGQGWLTWFDAAAQVEHHHETTNKDVFGQLQMVKMGWKNADYFTRKHATMWQLIQYYVWRPWWYFKRQQFINSIHET